MTKFKNMTVYCQCGQEWCRYKKGNPKGRLVKINPDRVVSDTVGLFTSRRDAVGTEVFCLGCGDRAATVQLISGKHYYKLNQGKVGKIVKS